MQIYCSLFLIIRSLSNISNNLQWVLKMYSVSSWVKYMVYIYCITYQNQQIQKKDNNCSKLNAFSKINIAFLERIFRFHAMYEKNSRSVFCSSVLLTAVITTIGTLITNQKQRVQRRSKVASPVYNNVGFLEFSADEKLNCCDLSVQIMI